MTWDEANHIHVKDGHDHFVAEAVACGKSEMFIRNVCNNQKCVE